MDQNVAQRTFPKTIGTETDMTMRTKTRFHHSCVLGCCEMTGFGLVLMHVFYVVHAVWVVFFVVDYNWTPNH